MKKTLEYFKEKKKRNRKITVLTAYDYPTTRLVEEAGIDMIILGDSIGTNVLGCRDETEVTLDDMVYHTKIVCRAKGDAFLVADLPYRTHETPEQAVESAGQLVSAGADAVKFEGIKPDVLAALKKQGMTVMCHIGLNPQYHQEDMRLGKIARGKVFEEAVELLKGARLLEAGGADLIVLEKIPEKLAGIITRNTGIPTIGIGAGRYCDGQVLIIYDVLGMNRRKYKHVPDYGNLRQLMLETLVRYREEVVSGSFPGREHINIIKDLEYEKVTEWCVKNGFVTGE